MSHVARPERLRQTLLAQFDRCPLSARFAMESELRSPSVLAARGTLAHRFFAAALNEMRRQGERKIPVEVAMEILTRVVAQVEAPDLARPGEWVPCPPEDVVHVPVEELRWMRVLATKFAYGHSYSVERVVGVERRLTAEIPVLGAGGETYLRTISGALDVLLAEPPDGAIVVDYKTGWSPPPAIREKKEDVAADAPREDRLSEMGYAQQTVYGYLVLANFPAVEWVALREYYVMSDEVREARVERWQMERVRDVLSALVSQLDAAVDATPELDRRAAVARADGRRVPQGRWIAAPGTHCSMCPRPRDCPVRDEVGIPADYEEARLLVGEWHQAGEMRKERTALVHGAVDRWGEVELPYAKGRKVVGHEGGSRRLSIYEPEEAAENPFDVAIEEVARERGVLVE